MSPVVVASKMSSVAVVVSFVDGTVGGDTDAVTEGMREDDEELDGIGLVEGLAEGVVDRGSERERRRETQNWELVTTSGMMLMAE